MTRASKARAHLHGSRYMHIYAQYCDFGSGVFNSARCSVVIWHSIQDGYRTWIRSFERFDLSYTQIILFIAIFDQDIKKQKILLQKKTDFSFLLTPIVFCCLNFQRCTFLCYFAKGGESGDLMYWKLWKLRNQGHFIWNLLTYGIYLFFCGISQGWGITRPSS